MLPELPGPLPVHVNPFEDASQFECITYCVAFRPTSLDTLRSLIRSMGLAATLQSQKLAEAPAELEIVYEAAARWLARQLASWN